MQNSKIGFIGGGNMAASLMGGLIADDFPAEQISVSDISAERLAQLKEQLKVNTYHDAQALLENCDLIVLSTKPQQLKDVIESIGPSLQSHHVLLSVAAGVTSRNISDWIGSPHAIVRAMPNTPAMVNSGATALYANSLVNQEQKDLCEAIMRAVGVAVWVSDEAQMDIVTALSGSGPAYFFYLMELMIEHAVDMGLDQETAKLLALQTAVGASKLAMESDDDVAELRKKVTSPGGTTERALQVMQKGDFKGMVADLLEAAASRSRDLSKMFG